MKEPTKGIGAVVQPRKDNRYRLEVPVIFSWKDAQEIREQGVGLTHDLSVRGAFIFANSPPPLNANLELKVYLPERSAAPPLRIYGKGQDPNAALPVLATYLGHVNIACTTIYLHPATELLVQAGARFQDHVTATAKWRPQ